MRFGRLVRYWLLPALLAIVALVAWQAANEADFDPSEATEKEYTESLETPVLTARRIPRTLRAPVNASRAAPGINRVINQAPSEQLCVVVRDGDRLLGNQQEVAGGLVPASNQKLLTTYTALEMLGPDFTFTTRVTAAAPPTDGLVDGDLYLVGDGDPFLITDNWLGQYEEIDGRSHTRLEALADSVVEAGVVEVSGSVIGDESLYDAERYGPWDGRLITQKQSGPMSALTVNEGFIDWPETFRDSFRPRSESPDPPVDAASVFTQLLRERGVAIAGPPGSGLRAQPGAEIAAVDSPPLIDTVTHINSYSSNIGAELLLKRLGLVGASQGTTAAGAAVVTDYLANQGIPTDAVRIFDGSGLAETNRLTCTAVAAILASAGPDTPFGQSLSIAGERGSLRNRFVDTPADGMVQAKTGTLRGVRALSGYVRSGVPTDPEVYLTFALIVNDDEVIEDEPIFSLQDPFVSSLTRYPAGPPIEEISPAPATPTDQAG